MRELLKAILSNLLSYVGMTWRIESNSNKKVVYLTFDDGPNPEFTEELLEILKSYNVYVTFFLIGENCELHNDIVSRIIEEGHGVGNHSYNHISFKKLNWYGIKYQIEKTDTLLSKHIGSNITYIRPPRGEWGVQYLLYTLLKTRKTVFWSIDPKDFSCNSSQQILDRINIQSIQNGDVILLHDKSQFTLDAIRHLIPALLDNGFELERIRETLNN